MKNNHIDMVWRYKYYISIINACETVLAYSDNEKILKYYTNKRKNAFQQLLDFQVAFHSKD